MDPFLPEKKGRKLTVIKDDENKNSEKIMLSNISETSYNNNLVIYIFT